MAGMFPCCAMQSRGWAVRRAPGGLAGTCGQDPPRVARGLRAGSQQQRQRQEEQNRHQSPVLLAVRPSPHPRPHRSSRTLPQAAVTTAAAAPLQVAPAEARPWAVKGLQPAVAAALAPLPQLRNQVVGGAPLQALVALPATALMGAVVAASPASGAAVLWRAAVPGILLAPAETAAAWAATLGVARGAGNPKPGSVAWQPWLTKAASPS
mmetsp:Transcript_80917/g.187936  ORF Transcript_80917/g.187936 Transcript_80917/m.187936 type:complete len:209 (-) Transcript_80917:95-721(-)